MKKVVNNGIIKEINEEVQNLQYGTITLVVHDSRIVQVEVLQKKRFDNVWGIEKGDNR